MSINHWNWPSEIFSYENSTHFVCDLNHIPPTNTAMLSIKVVNSHRYYSHLFSNTAISLVHTLCHALSLPVDNCDCFILSSRSISIGVMAESISSDHCYGLRVLSITVLMISTFSLRDSIGIL